MGFLYISGQLLDRYPGRGARGFRIYRRLDFRAGEEWFSVRFVLVPTGLNGALERGATGSFFFLQVIGLSLLFCVSVSGRAAAISTRAVQRVARVRFLCGLAFGTAGVFLYPEPRCTAFACALMLLACYNMACGLLHGESRAGAFMRGEFQPRQPDAHLQGS